VFPVRYELDLYILFRRKSVFKGLKGMFSCHVNPVVHRNADAKRESRDGPADAKLPLAPELPLRNTTLAYCCFCVEL
jgi:hypothetical protein